MATVICVKCDVCGKLGTKDLPWVQVEETKEEVLLCVCGNRKWKFVEMDSGFLGPEILVVSMAVGEK